MPSLKYSASASALMLRKGRTAIEDASAAAACGPEPESRAAGKLRLALDDLQGEDEIARRLEAILGILFEQVLDDRRELRRHDAARTGIGRVVLQDRHHGLDRAVAVEGAPAGQHLVQHRSEREEVAARIDVSPRICSGAMKPGVPTTMPGCGDARIRRRGGGHRRPRPDGQARSRGSSTSPSSGQEHVLRLQVAVHDAAVVRRGRGRARSAARTRWPCAPGAPRPRGASPKRLALEQLHHGIETSPSRP